MALSLLQFFVYLALLWLILIYLSNRYDLEKRGILIAPGIFILKTTKLNSIFEKLSTKLKLTDRFTNIVIRIILIVFIILPLILFVNVVRAFFTFSSPLLVPNPITKLNAQLVLLIIIPFLFALIVHELSIAIVAKSENVGIKYSGIAIIGIFITSFVRISSASYKKLNNKKKLKIISFPIFNNLLIALLLIPVLIYSSVLILPLYNESAGALVVDVDTNGPGYDVGLKQGDVILSIKKLQFNTPIQSFKVNSANDLLAILRNIPNGEKIIIELGSGTLLFIVGILPPQDSVLISGSYLGIEVFDYHPPKLSFMSNLFPYFFTIELQWLINLNLIFGLFNLLPLPITDGGKILDMLIDSSNIKKFKKTTLKKIGYYTSGILIALNLLFTVFN